MTQSSPGLLYVVATPIGNLGDMSARARRTLAEVDHVLAEDTRAGRRLLTHFGIEARLSALHEHNEAQRIGQCLEWLRAGQHLALICDAGTPLVNDPGYRLVAAAHEAGVRVSPAPGACSPIAALSVSGLPTDRFVYEGFLPARATARLERLRALESERRTLVFLEASHRIQATLHALAEVWPDRPLALAKELTKIHEAVLSGTAQQLLDWIQADPARAKGEFVLMAAGAEAVPAAVGGLDTDTLLRVLMEELPTAKAAKLAAKLTGLERKTLYRQALQMSIRDA